MKRSADKRRVMVRGLAVVLVMALCASVTGAAEGTANQVRDIKVQESGGKTTITVVGSARPSFTAFKLTSPQRLVIDLSDTEVRGVPTVLEEATKLVSGVAVSQYAVNGTSVARLMVNFRGDAAYRVSSRGQDLVITLTGAPAGKAAAGEPPAVADPGMADELAKARRDAESARQEAERSAAELKRLIAENGATRVEADNAKRAAAEATARLAETKTAQAKVEDLAQRIQNLQSELDRVRQAEAKATEARTRAEREAADAKLRASETVSARNAAVAEHEQAVTAERQAAVAYRQAVESERARLLSVLKERERESADAKARVAVADAARRESEVAARKTAFALSRAEQEAALAARHAADTKQRAEKELALAEQKRVAAEERARRAESELARLKSDTNSTYEQRLARADSERQSAERRLTAAQARLAELEQRNQTVAAQAASASGELAVAKSTISEQQKQIATLQQAEAAASQNARLTQEELRLQRLAAMQGKAPETKPAAAPMIQDIKFVADGATQKVVIVTRGKVDYNAVSQPNGVSAMTFRNVTLGPALERTLDVADYGGVVSQISSYRNGDEVKLEVKVAGKATSEVARKDQELVWTFNAVEPPKAGVAKAEVAKEGTAAAGTKTRTVNREDAATYEFPLERTAAYSAPGGVAPGTKKKHYTGRHIDLDFKDADIHNILRLLADVGQVNIITSDEVTGEVTIRMRDVAWDHALDVILTTKNLGMVRDGNLIRVAPLAALEKEREMEIARRKQAQTLTPLETRLIPVSYAQAAEIQPRAQDLLTERGKLSVDGRTNVLIARDTGESLDQIEALVRSLDTQTPQVLIEGRIVEATSTYAREIGIQWGGDFAASAATGNPTGLAFPSSVGLAGGATDDQTPVAGMGTSAGARPNPNFAVNLPAAVGTGSGGALGITLGSVANNANLNLRLSALEDAGTLRILSSPKILTLDNREAFIEQGTMIPYSQVSAQGVQTAFKEAKLNLTVTPHVTADGSVLLKINMTRDEPDFNNKGARGDPTILKREAKTELLVSDGHTAVIGGIFTRNSGSSYKKVPFFADIPILGWIFKSHAESDRRTEMLIFITPRIVNRAESIGQ